jgi:hypothetical protein
MDPPPTCDYTEIKILVMNNERLDQVGQYVAKYLFLR